MTCHLLDTGVSLGFHACGCHSSPAAPFACFQGSSLYFFSSLTPLPFLTSLPTSCSFARDLATSLSTPTSTCLLTCASLSSPRPCSSTTAFLTPFPSALGSVPVYAPPSRGCVAGSACCIS